MCIVCIEFAERNAADIVSDPYGDIAQLVERFHGMEEVGGSIPPISTDKLGNAPQCRRVVEVLSSAFARSYEAASFTLGGLIAAEGCFMVTTKQPPFKNGDPRLRFVFAMNIAQRDRPLLEALRMCLGVGSIHDTAPRKSHWLPSSTFSVGSMHAHRRATIPFCERFLPTTAKRRQFELWRNALYSFDLLHPSRYGKGPSPCKVVDCDLPVRGRGLCRKHYYLETGY
jgi:hypothetical protein